VAKFDVTKLIRKDGRHVPPDGRGLSLYVRGNSALWVRQFRDPKDHKIKSRSLGSAKGPHALNLTQARAACEDNRGELRNGNTDRKDGTGKTFGEVLELYIADKATRPNGHGWRGGADGEEATAYRRTLRELEAVAVSTIDTPTIAGVLKLMKPATAEKTRVRVKAVLDWAKSMGLRTGDNPAAKEVMKPLLTLPPDPVHHPALPAADVPVLMKELLALDTPAARALQWTILTAARTDETLGATWSEIKGDTWTIPGARMKEGKEHRVPLTPAALALLGERGEGLVFGAMGGQAMLLLLKSKRPGMGMTVHGLRSSFRDWATDKSGIVGAEGLAEYALAHRIDDAYARSDMFDRRRALMQAWADFATG
jgi:integrase